MASRSFTIREATWADAGAVVAMAQDWEREGSTLGHVAAAEGYYAVSPDIVWLVAIDAERHHAGYLYGAIKREHLAVLPAGAAYLEIEELYVVPALRSAGIGAALIAEARTRALRRGAGYMHLFTASRQLDRISSFYRQQGFRPWAFQAYADISTEEE
jgi:GNAT superfamily N-acetyltransferase